jgi:hypothetical protein
MIDRIIEAFPVLSDRCLESNATPCFYITDPGGDDPTEIIDAPLPIEEEVSYVKVFNESGHEIWHLSIDKCLTRDLQQKSCDAVLLNNAKIFFLELKLNVTTTILKNADDTREGALYQIAMTIELFKNELAKNNKSLDDVDVVGQVAMPPISPRSDATYKLIKSAFAEKYGYDFIDSKEVLFT